MITMCYCPDCAPKKVVAAGMCSSAKHVHDDESVHACTCLDVDEPNLSGNFPGETSDQTVVSDADEWLSYLSKYIPA